VSSREARTASGSFEDLYVGVVERLEGEEKYRDFTKAARVFLDIRARARAAGRAAVKGIPFGLLGAVATTVAASVGGRGGTPQGSVPEDRLRREATRYEHYRQLYDSVIASRPARALLVERVRGLATILENEIRAEYGKGRRA
jgi:hypothetical protein